MKRKTNAIRTERVTPSVYREAARRIERGYSNRSCVAIAHVLGRNYYCDGGDQLPAVQRYVEAVLGGVEWTYMLYPEEHSEAQNARVVALCFAAEMCRTGDL